MAQPIFKSALQALNQALDSAHPLEQLCFQLHPASPQDFAGCLIRLQSAKEQLARHAHNELAYERLALEACLGQGRTDCEGRFEAASAAIRLGLPSLT
jgi:hypothetical protein